MTAKMTWMKVKHVMTVFPSCEAPMLHDGGLVVCTFFEQHMFTSVDVPITLSTIDTMQAITVSNERPKRNMMFLRELRLRYLRRQMTPLNTEKEPPQIPVPVQYISVPNIMETRLTNDEVPPNIMLPRASMRSDLTSMPRN